MDPQSLSAIRGSIYALDQYVKPTSRRNVAWFLSFPELT